MSLTAILFWLAYIGGVCAAVVYPVIGMSLYVLVYHVHPETQWWGASFAASGIRPSLTVAAATLLGLLMRRPPACPESRTLRPPLVLMLTLVGYALVTTTWAEIDWARTDLLTEKTTKLAILALMFVACIRRPEDYTLVFLAWIVGVFYIGYQACGGAGTSFGGRLTLGLGGPDFGESSGLATHLVASLPLIGGLFFIARTWWGRSFALITGALTVNTIIMTRTRNAMVGVLLMAACGVFWLPRRYRVRGLLAIVVGAFLSLQLTDTNWWSRMETIRNYKADPSATERLRYWGAAAAMARDEPFGVGLGQFHRRIGDYVELDRIRSAHSSYMSCLGELGFPGLTIFIVLILTTLWQLNGIRVRAKDLDDAVPIHVGRWETRFRLAWHAMALQCALVGFLGCSIFTTRLWTEGFWLLVSLSCCLMNVECELRARQRYQLSSVELGDIPAGVTLGAPAVGCGGLRT